MTAGKSSFFQEREENKKARRTAGNSMYFIW